MKNVHDDKQIVHSYVPLHEFPFYFSKSLFEFLFFCSVAASGNNVFTSPEISKTFDFSSEEKIYKW